MLSRLHHDNAQRRQEPSNPTWIRAVLGAAAAVAISGAGQPALAQDIDSSWGDTDDFLDEDGEEDADYEQPPVTSGGLFTKESYPVAEIERPLTITGGIAEIRAALDLDMSANRAFEVFFTRLRGRYGLKDHIELQAGFDGLLGGEITPADVESGYHQAAVSFGVESALAYDLVNVRATAEIPLMPNRAFDLALGVPIRYRATPKVAIIAADRLLTIHTDGRKPDLTAGVGGLFQLMPQLSASVRAEITIFEFNTDRGPIVPVTAAVQYAVNNLVDLGLQLSFADLAADEGRFDRRFALLFGRLRI